MQNLRSHPILRFPADCILDRASSILSRTINSGSLQTMDVLSEVLRVVKLEGALFFNAEFSSPWCINSTQSSVLAPLLSSPAKHLILYHFLIEGTAYARIPEGRREELVAG